MNKGNANESRESPQKPTQRAPRTIGASLGWLMAYVIVAAGLGALLYRFLFATMLIVPLVAETVLVKSLWTTSSYWKGIVARFAGLVIANVLIYFLYVIPVIYEGKEPWSEEALWAYVVVGGQTVVAAIALLASRRLLRNRPGVKRPACPRRGDYNV